MLLTGHHVLESSGSIGKLDDHKFGEFIFGPAAHVFAIFGRTANCSGDGSSDESVGYQQWILSAQYILPTLPLLLCLLLHSDSTLRIRSSP